MQKIKQFFLRLLKNESGQFDPMTIAAIVSGGASLAKGLFGGQKQVSRYEMSPEERRIYQYYMQELEGEPPSSVTAPFARERKRIIQKGAREAGSTGLTSGLLQRLAAKRGEAIKGYRRGTMSQIAGLVGGRGERTTEQPVNWGEIAGGGFEDIASLLILSQLMPDLFGGGGGGGVVH